MNTHIPVLKGQDAINFEKYINRKPTKKEIAYVKKCDKFYRECEGRSKKTNTHERKREL